MKIFGEARVTRNRDYYNILVSVTPVHEQQPQQGSGRAALASRLACLAPRLPRASPALCSGNELTSGHADALLF